MYDKESVTARAVRQA